MIVDEQRVLDAQSLAHFTKQLAIAIDATHIPTNGETVLSTLDVYNHEIVTPHNKHRLGTLVEDLLLLNRGSTN